jgi:hypothetical protein
MYPAAAYSDDATEIYRIATQISASAMRTPALAYYDPATGLRTKWPLQMPIRKRFYDNSEANHQGNLTGTGTIAAGTIGADYHYCGAPIQFPGSDEILVVFGQHSATTPNVPAASDQMLDHFYVARIADSGIPTFEFIEVGGSINWTLAYTGNETQYQSSNFSYATLQTVPGDTAVFVAIRRHEQSTGETTLVRVEPTSGATKVIVTTPANSAGGSFQNPLIPLGSGAMLLGYMPRNNNLGYDGLHGLVCEDLSAAGMVDEANWYNPITGDVLASLPIDADDATNLLHSYTAGDTNIGSAIGDGAGSVVILFNVTTSGLDEDHPFEADDIRICAKQGYSTSTHTFASSSEVSILSTITDQLDVGENVEFLPIIQWADATCVGALMFCKHNQGETLVQNTDYIQWSDGYGERVLAWYNPNVKANPSNWVFLGVTYDCSTSGGLSCRPLRFGTAIEGGLFSLVEITTSVDSVLSFANASYVMVEVDVPSTSLKAMHYRRLRAN